MRKEFLLAILIGLICGLFITYGVYQAKQPPANPDQNLNQLANQLTPTLAVDSGELTLYHPTDGLVLAEAKTTITGKTIPNSKIVIFINDDPIITTADATGNFSKEVGLATLSNLLLVYAIDEDGQQIQAERTVIVYPPELIISSAASAAATPKPTGKTN